MRTTIMETHLTFRSSTSSVVFFMFFNHKRFCISSANNHQRDSFLEPTVVAMKLWMYKESCWDRKNCKIFDVKFLSSRGMSNSWTLPSRGSVALKIVGSYNSKSWKFSRFQKRRSTADLIHARMLQIQALRLGFTFPNTVYHESRPQEFAEASKSEAWMDSMRRKLSSLNTHKKLDSRWLSSWKKSNTMRLGIQD